MGLLRVTGREADFNQLAGNRVYMQQQALPMRAARGQHPLGCWCRARGSARSDWYGRALGRRDSERIPISLMNRDAWPAELLLSLPLPTGGDTQPRSVRGAAMFTGGKATARWGPRCPAWMPGNPAWCGELGHAEAPAELSCGEKYPPMAALVF